MENVLCPYCGDAAKLVTGKDIYPHREDLRHKWFYRCERKRCNAYVGCHPGTTEPLGRLANAELRDAKMGAHAAFDPIWLTGQMTRSHAYAWLAFELGINVRDCHIGMFDIDTCIRVIEVCEARNGKKTHSSTRPA